MNNHLCGAGMALLGFTTTLIIGLVVGNPFLTIVWRAIQILVLFYILGYGLCFIGLKAVKENFITEANAIRQREQARRNEMDAAAQQPSDGDEAENTVNPTAA